MKSKPIIRSTTVIGLILNGQAAIGGDGQVSFDDMIMKSSAVKIRSMHDDKILAGFAGSVGDALSLFDIFEKKLEEFDGNLQRASIELVKEWRTDRSLQQLEAIMVVTDAKNIYVISGTGDVIEPDDQIATIGSGGSFALAAARAFIECNPKMSAVNVARKSLEVAADICIFTNRNIKVESLK